VGIIIRQTFKSTIYVYLGAVLGFLTTGILFPRYLSTEEIGIIGVVVSYSLIIAQVSSLGFNNVTIKLFPYFDSADGKNRGFTSILLLVSLLGSIVVFIIYFLLQEFYWSTEENGREVQSFYIWIIPFTLSVLWFYIFDTYNRALLNASFGLFLKEFFQRCLILIFLVLFILLNLSFRQFVVLYLMAFLVPFFTIILYLTIKKNLILTPIKNLPGEFVSDAKRIGLFGLISGLSSIAVFNIDRIMIDSMVGTSQTGIYIIMSYFGVLVSMPSRGLNRIATSIVAQSFKKDDLESIAKIYSSSSLNQYLFGMFLFLGLVVNTHGILDFLPEEYSEGKAVLIVIGLSNLIIMLGGINNGIIANSPFYSYQAYFTLALVAISVLSNFLLIPIFEITGAACASLLSILIFNGVKWQFLKYKYGLQPYGPQYFWITLLGLFIYILLDQIPYLGVFYFDIIMRSVVTAIVFGLTVYRMRWSEEFNTFVDSLTSQFRARSKN
jgi:O-antigen/teichoic acid export membrane protein